MVILNTCTRVIKGTKMKLDKIDNLVKSSTLILQAVRMLNEVKSYNELQIKLLDVSEFLLKEYEKHGVPSDEIKDLIDEINLVGVSKDAK